MNPKVKHEAWLTIAVALVAVASVMVVVGHGPVSDYVPTESESVEERWPVQEYPVWPDVAEVESVPYDLPEPAVPESEQVQPMETAEPVEPEPEPAWPISEQVPLSMELQQVLADSCQEHGVPVALMLGLIEQESNFDPDADNGTAYGLTQLNRAWWPDGLSHEENLRTGIGYLGECLAKRDGDWMTALMMYHDGHVSGHKVYSRAVMARAQEWEARL